MNLTVGIFGDEELAKTLGKKGTTNDIAIYNHASSEGIFTYVRPNSEKVQSLLQTIAMTDIPVVVINELTPETGETLIALDAYSFEKGFILLGDKVVKEQIDPIIKGTGLERFEMLAKDAVELRQKLSAIKIADIEGDAKIPIDNYFMVKSVGTVILGLVKRGSVKEYDKLVIEPLGKEILVKSIQSHGKNIKEAGCYVRVGLSVKGADVDTLKRGQIICKKDSLQVKEKLDVDLKRNKFFKGTLDAGKSVFIACGLQVPTAIIEKVEGDTITLKPERPVALDGTENIVLASTEQKMPRIIGSGKLS